MQTDAIPPFNQLGTPLGVCVADGHGIQLRVERSHLVVEDGIGRSRRKRRFHKATSDLRRMVVLGTTGYLTVEAIYWLADAGVPLIHIDGEGRVLVTSHPMGSDRAALRRAQAWAVTNETGLQVVRYLLDRKLEGQAHIAERLGGDRSEIDVASHKLEQVESLNEMMWLEATAANSYWHAWAEVECRFIRKDEGLIPEHWRRFGTRGSRFNSSGPRGAANPINAILNYLYALLEAEAVIACQTVGLDPGIGILHADQKARDSLSLDLMEPVRPSVDQWVLNTLAGHRFRAADFFDTRRGICRLAPTIAHWLAETTTRWAADVAPHAERVAQMIGETPGIRVDRIPTPLTGSIRSASRPPRPPKPVSTARPSHCHTCGGEAPKGRTQCEACYPLVQHETLKQYLTSGHETLAAMRATGTDPAHGGAAAAKRGDSNREHQLAVRDWNEGNDRLPQTVFFDEILPTIQSVSIRILALATGLTPGYCSFIRRGLKVPHQRHWPALLDTAKSMGAQNNDARIGDGDYDES